MKRFLVSKTPDAPAAAAAAATKRAKSSRHVGRCSPPAPPRPQLKLSRPRKIGHHDDLDVLYYPRFLNDGSITPALANLPLEESTVVMFGKIIKEPRRTGFFSSNDRPLKYSGSVRYPLPLTEEMESIRRKIEELPDVQKALFKERGKGGNERNKLKNMIVGIYRRHSERTVNLRHPHRDIVLQDASQTSMKTDLITWGSTQMMRQRTAH